MFAALLSLFLAVDAPLVVIDPGHGGPHLGARGSCGVVEKDIVLAIGIELASILEMSGAARVVLTRDDDSDVGLAARAELANRLGARLFISIHANASTSPHNAGAETFFLSLRGGERRHRALLERENRGQRIPEVEFDSVLDEMLARLETDAAHRESQRLAVRLYNELARASTHRARRVMQAPFIVLRHASMAAALVEVGFLTHPEQCEELSTSKHRRDIATRLAAAVIAHLDSEKSSYSPSVVNALTAEDGGGN
ncbi:MAG: N-acetylmuramoyl-L-alanine amidase [Myxococcota bacterium]